MGRNNFLLKSKKESERNKEIIKNIRPAPTNDLVKNQKIKIKDLSQCKFMVL